MPHPDVPSGQPTDADAGAGSGDGGSGSGDATGGGDLGALDPLPRTGTSAPAAHQPYATAREAVGTRIAAPAPVDRGPYGGAQPANPDAGDTRTHDTRTGDPDRYGPGEDGGPTASERPPPDGRWSGGSAASDAARAARAAPAGQSVRPGGYRPGEPIRRPASAGAAPGPAAVAGPGRPAGPVGPELVAASRRTSRAALFLAIAGVFLTIAFFPVGAALDIGAIVLGVRARRLARRARTSGAPGGVAIGLGVPALVAAAFFAVITAVFWTEVRSFASCSSTAITTTTRDECTAQLRTDLQRRVDSLTR